MSNTELEFESGEASLSVRSFRVDEGVSRPFDVAVIALSPNQIDLETIVGRPAAFNVASGVAHVIAPRRRWTGICHHIELVQSEPTGLSTYDVRIRPALWLLSQRRGYRVHQHRSIPDIVDHLLQEWRIRPEWQIEREAYPKLAYKVQYGETDLAFLSRILEEAGIAYTLEDRLGQPTRLTFSDALHKRERRAVPLPWAGEPNEEAGREFVTELGIAHEVRPGAYTIRDFDHRRPAYTLGGRADPAAGIEATLEQFVYEPGGFLVEGAQPGDTPVADDKGIARHEDRFGADRARRALAAARAGRRSVRFRTNVLDLAPGTVFTIEDHPHGYLAAGALLLATGQTFEGTVGGAWTTRSHAAFASEPWLPPPITPKPAVEGVQSATVVGTAGQEIETDEFGRVRVQFPWDREGKNDQDSSFWVRVSQGWAGTGFGMLNLPRIGQEVLIGFLEGDPDEPVIVGRVFNATNPVPYALPEHKTRSTWKSQSSPGGNGFNEILFEDLAGRELVYVQAEKDLRKLVKNDETITVGNDRQKLVRHDETEITGADRTEVTGANRTEITKRDRTTAIDGTRRELVQGDSIERLEADRQRYVGGDQHLTVMGVKRELVERERHTLVKGDRKEQVGGTYGLTAGSHHIACGAHAVGAGGTIYLKAGAEIVVEAPDITIKAPGGFIRLDGSGVTIQGSLVKINCGDSAPDFSGGGGGNPERPIEAKVERPKEPQVDDVSKTGLGPGR